MFFLLYKHTVDGVFYDFPKISDHFPKISEDFPKLFRRPDERFRTFSENFRKLPKMSEDFRRLPKTFEEDPKMFRWYTNEFKYNLRNKLDNTEIIDTCEDIISSHMRISYRFYQFVTTRYTTDVYIIKKNIIRWLEDRNFIFSWQEQNLRRSLRSLVRYCSCHSNIKFISSRHRAIFSI